MHPHAASTPAAAATTSLAPNLPGAQICWTNPECSGTSATLQACYWTIGGLVDPNDCAQSGAFQVCAESPGDVKGLWVTISAFPLAAACAFFGGLERRGELLVRVRVLIWGGLCSAVRRSGGSARIAVFRAGRICWLNTFSEGLHDFCGTKDLPSTSSPSPTPQCPQRVQRRHNADNNPQHALRPSQRLERLA